jgi:Holliday junction resolvasome RuvABC endonuclease subunit
MINDFLGIDPGLKGGFAVVSGDKIRYKMAMPTLSFTTRDCKTKTGIDRAGVLSFLATLPPHTHVAIEEQEAFRSQDITSTCTTCKNYGMLLMALTVARCFVTEVPSSVWQAHFGIVSVKKGDHETTKVQAYRICRLHYPYESFRKSQRAFTPHDGIVDAVLIAEYCQSLFAPFLQLIEPLKVAPINGVEGTTKPLEYKTPEENTK